jgi:hypothetical protein
MQQRGLVEEHSFRDELKGIIANPREADEFLEAAVLHLCLYADLEPQLNGTKLFYKTIPYPLLNRVLVLWFTIEPEHIVLRSITSFEIPPEDCPF